MSKKQPPYAPEYRRQMVELVRTGRAPGELAREFGVLRVGDPQLGASSGSRRGTS